MRRVLRMFAEQRLELKKGEHTYLVRYPAGAEGAVVSALADWAANEELNFDWTDATMLTIELGVTRRFGEDEIGEEELRNIGVSEIGGS